MEKKLHTPLGTHQDSETFPDAHHTIYQSILEEEYAAELALLKNGQASLHPRPEAVQALLQMIAPQSVTEGQH